MGDAVWKVKLCGLIQRGDRLDLVRDWNDCPEVTALIDTGASASVITRALANRAGAEIMPGLRTFRGRSYAGALMALELEGWDRSFHVVVVDDLLAEEAEPHALMILGRDYLQDNRVRIDEVRDDDVVRLKITRAETTALRGLARQSRRISSSATATRASEESMEEELKRRCRRGTDRFYLYFEIERSTGQLSLKTSWLPDLPEVQLVLSPLGFHRSPDGSYRVALKDTKDLIGILRCATKALAFLLEEATL